jgi:hypothetical protein
MERIYTMETPKKKKIIISFFSFLFVFMIPFPTEAFFYDREESVSNNWQVPFVDIVVEISKQDFVFDDVDEKISSDVAISFQKYKGSSYELYTKDISGDEDLCDYLQINSFLAKEYLSGPVAIQDMNKSHMLSFSLKESAVKKEVDQSCELIVLVQGFNDGLYDSEEVSFSFTLPKEETKSETLNVEKEGASGEFLVRQVFQENALEKRRYEKEKTLVEIEEIERESKKESSQKKTFPKKEDESEAQHKTDRKEDKDEKVSNEDESPVEQEGDESEQEVLRSKEVAKEREKKEVEKEDKMRDGDEDEGDDFDTTKNNALSDDEKDAKDVQERSLKKEESGEKPEKDINKKQEGARQDSRQKEALKEY